MIAYGGIRRPGADGLVKGQEKDDQGCGLSQLLIVWIFA